MRARFWIVGAIVAVLVVAAGVLVIPRLMADDAGDPPSSAGGSPSADRPASPTEAPTETGTTEPSSQDPGAVATPLVLLGPDGTIDSWSAGASSAGLADHLTATLGDAPRVSDGACASSADPGETWTWPDLTVIVRTTDADGNPTDSYLAGWVITTDRLGLPTGLSPGDTTDELERQYPQAVGEPWFGDLTLWTLDGGPAFDDSGYTAVSADGLVQSITGGYACGE